MKNVILLGRTIQLAEITKAQLKGITIDDALSYTFYSAVAGGVSMVFVEPKKNPGTPRSLAITSDRLNTLFKKPIVYILTSCPAFERQRLIDKNVFFIVSEKFAFLPNLMANERMKTAKPAKILTPVAQYILLYHLQTKGINGESARSLENIIPYSYTSITLGIACLEELGLLSRTTINGKSKVIQFELSGRKLWDAAQNYLINPVDETVYCDQLHTQGFYPIGGINALSHYTMLNPDSEKMLVMTKQQWQGIKESDVLVNANKYDGNIIVEVWKYPPVGLKDDKHEWVDRLSLAISLKDDEDPRVEGEVERLINETEWKD